jgi:broad specificity phosphatase PhoE
MTILLVRHGETVGNAQRVLQRPEIPLNERGIRQAEQLAERLLTLGFVHVLCSDLMRAQMTAAPLRARAGVVFEETPLLQERNFGDLRGTPYAELTEDPFAPGFSPPNGETIEVFHRRVAAAFELIAERRRGLSGPLVVVTHGLVCRAIMDNHVAGGRSLPPDRFDNTSLTILDEGPPFAAQLINCTEHLVRTHEEARPGGAA